MVSLILLFQVKSEVLQGLWRKAYFHNNIKGFLSPSLGVFLSEQWGFAGPTTAGVTSSVWWCDCFFWSYKIFSALISNMVNTDRQAEALWDFCSFLRVKTVPETLAFDKHDLNCVLQSHVQIWLLQIQQQISETVERDGDEDGDGEVETRDRRWDERETEIERWGGYYRVCTAQFFLYNKPL